MKMRCVVVIIFAMIIINPAVVGVSNNATYQSNIEIHGVNQTGNITLNITDDIGIIKIFTSEMQIELFNLEQNTEGYNYELYYIGRNITNFVIIKIYCGNSFLKFNASIFLYRNGKMNTSTAYSFYIFDEFSGNININNAITPNPTIIENYTPKGFIPNYNSTDFQIDFSGIYITPNFGNIYREIYNLYVYSLTFYEQNSQIEIWAIGKSKVNGTIYAINIKQNKEIEFINLGTCKIDRRFQVIITKFTAIRSVQRQIVLGDTEAPKISINIENNTIIGFETNFDLQVSDDIAIKYIIIRIDDEYYTTIIKSPYRFTIDPSTYNEGIHKINIIAVDYSSKSTELVLQLTFQNGILRQIPYAFMKTLTILGLLTIIYIGIEKLEKRNEKIVRQDGL